MFAAITKWHMECSMEGDEMNGNKPYLGCLHGYIFTSEFRATANTKVSYKKAQLEPTMGWEMPFFSPLLCLDWPSYQYTMP
jgi:hypothetical protein